jgi:CheY-like chemotaxis protein
MAAGVAHEINNPLSFIGLATEMLGLRVGPEEASLVAEVRTGVDRITAIVRDLRFFGREDDDPPGPIDLTAAIDAAERLVLHEIRPRGQLVKELGPLPAVVGVARHLEQVFVNLFLNAAHAIDEKAQGRIVVRASVMAERVVVLVEDDGCGMPKETLDVMFEPFFTTRAVSGGTGLGLSICRDIVVRTGGDLVARSTVGKGTTMELTLVRANTASVEAAALAAPRLPAEVRARTPPRRVLVVDDEPLIVRSLTKMLASRATVVGETVAARALELVLADPAFDAVVCDVMMPGMTGIDLHERVARERPERARRFVFVTGGTYTARARQYLERVSNPRLDKPFDVAGLVAAIERVVLAEGE